MVSKQMFGYGSVRSCIRELFEFGKKRAEVVGKENVFDFSIGNPSIPAPKQVQDAIVNIITKEDIISTHGYSSAAGNDIAREAIAASLNRKNGTSFTKANFFITGGAAPALVSCFRALTESPEAEFVAIAPFFPEYRCFVEGNGGTLKVVPADTVDFQVNFSELEKTINEKTKAVIINSPNNPSGVVYTEETILHLAKILSAKSAEYGHPIFIISDEPYRELVYGGVKVPFVTKYYKNTLVCYSYSKSLSLPGERIGYVLVPSEVENFEEIYAAIAGGARSAGHVCANTLFQKVVAACVDVAPDLVAYEKNRNLLYENMTKMGYRCAKPDGAFYLFFEAPNGHTGYEFSDMAKEENLLIVPGNDFGCPNHLRISYCVTEDQIRKALPIFERLIKKA